MILRKLNGEMPDEMILEQLRFDDTREARLIVSRSSGAMRISLVDKSTGEEFGNVPLEDRSREGLIRAVSAVSTLQEQLQAARDAAPTPLSRATPAEVLPLSSLTFADKVETLAKHIERAVMLSMANGYREFYKKGRVPTPDIPASILESYAHFVKPGREYWYVSTRSGRRFAVSVDTELVFPVNYQGAMKGAGMPIADMGAYNWATDNYWPPKLPEPVPVTWVRSPLKSPSTAPKRPRAERQVRIKFAPNPDVKPWAPSKKLSANLIALRGRTGDMAQGWMGGNHDKTRGLKSAEIAKLMRADIKQAIADGNLPPMEFSVTTDSYSGGYSINIRVTRLLASVPIVNPAWAEFRLRNGPDARTPLNLDRTTPEASVILRQIAAIHDSYNRDNSDRGTDYYDVRFSGDVRFDGTLLGQQEYDALYLNGLVNWPGRRDAYAEDSLHEAFRDDTELRKLYRVQGGLRVYRLGPDEVRVQIVDGRGGKAQVFTEMDSPEGDILEVASSLAREFLARKPNGRHASCRIAS